MRIFILVGILATSVAYSQTTDWQLVGGTDDAYVFYDAKGIRRVADDHFEVWLKALPASAIDKTKLDKDGVDHAAKKVLSGYVPPIGLTHKLTKDQIISAIASEEIASAAVIEPKARMLEEIDCRNLSTRHLSVSIRVHGKYETSDRPSTWQRIAPETNFATLQAAICG
jgi:hypothetical protein